MVLIWLIGQDWKLSNFSLLLNPTELFSKATLYGGGGVISEKPVNFQSPRGSV